jgi:hypothetical protein
MTTQEESSDTEVDNNTSTSILEKLGENYDETFGEGAFEDKRSTYRNYDEATKEHYKASMKVWFSKMTKEKLGIELNNEQLEEIYNEFC